MKRSAEEDLGAAERPSVRLLQKPTYSTIDQHKHAYRVCGIPASYDAEALQSALCEALDLSETSDLRIYSFASDVQSAVQTRTATVTFSNRPGLFGEQHNRWTIDIPGDPGSTTTVPIYVDVHFLGFTPLSPVESDSSQTIDCIAIHGLGGHALGSFKDPESCFVWLRDDLPAKFPNLRVWVYGYDSNLQSTDSYGEIQDYAVTFRRLFKSIRKRSGLVDTSTPSIFIAHSLGGLLLKEAFIGMGNDNVETALLRTTYAVLFFGVPSQGMDTSALAAMVDEKPKRLTLEMLNQNVGHSLREKQHKAFCEAFNFSDSRLIRFFELVASATVHQDPQTGKWTRSGDRKLLVTPPSAKQGRPQDSSEDEVPIQADHMGIVKFAPDDRVEYPKVEDVISDLVERAVPAVGLRLAQETPANSEATAMASQLQELIEGLPVASGAAFDSARLEHEPLCLNGTRQRFLRVIYDWAVNPAGKQLFWLNGMAGTGKSTISRTVARHLADKGLLGATFFFSRGDGDRGNASRFITSIAYQLAHRIPQLRILIAQALQANSKVEQKRDQWRQLVAEPLSKAKLNIPSLVFVIDAVDECDNQDDVRLILQILAETNVTANFKLRVFVTSRPEQPISFGFRRMDGSVHEDMVLHDVFRDEADQDILRFLEHEFQGIKLDRDIEEDWPTAPELQELCQKAHGLFIYAMTAVRFINQVFFDPDEQLRLILQTDSGSNSIYENLDNMYMAVLTRSILDQCEERHQSIVAQRFREVVGCIVLLYQPLTTPSLSKLLRMKEKQVLAVLEPLGSLLARTREAQIQLLHPSFRDFLLNNERCKDFHFYVQSGQAHANITKICLDIMEDKLQKDICQMKHPGTLVAEVDRSKIAEHIPPELNYACVFWMRHMEAAMGSLNENESLQMLARVSKFLSTHFLHWLEALSLLSKAREMIPILISLISQLQPSHPTTELMIDAQRFLMSHCSTIELAPLQVYISVLLFIPSASKTRDLFPVDLEWLSPKPRVAQDWSSLMHILGDLPDISYGIAFAPDGKTVAASSRDGSISIWDCVSGALHQVIKEGPLALLKIGFSPDGSKIVSMCREKRAQVWDVKTGKILYQFEHEHGVYTAVHSPVENTIVIGTGAGTLQVCNSQAGQVLYTWEGHAELVDLICFTPAGDKLVSAGDDRLLKIWSVKSRTLLHTLKGHMDEICSVHVSGCGTKIASMASDKSLRIWNTQTGTLLRSLELAERTHAVGFTPSGDEIISWLGHHSLQVRDIYTGQIKYTIRDSEAASTAVTFSPSGDRFAAACWDRKVRIWDSNFLSLPGNLEKHEAVIRELVFSPKGDKLVSGSEDAATKVWDTETGQLLYSLKEHATNAAFSPDGDKLVTGAAFKNPKLWDVDTGKFIRTIESGAEGIHAIAFSPGKGERLAFGHWDGPIKICGTETGALLRSFKGDAQRSWTVAFSPGRGERVACGSYDGKLQVWDAENGTLITSIQAHEEPIHFVAFSTNTGNKVASGCGYDGTVKIWDASTGASLDVLQMRPDLVPWIMASPSYQPPRLSIDRSWITIDDERILLLPPDCFCSKVRVDGNKIAIGSEQGNVIILGFDFDKALAFRDL